MNTPAKVRRRRIALWLLIPATVLFLCSLAPAGLMMMYSPLAFDAGGTPAIWLFVLTVWAYPVVVLITVAAAWISFALGAYRAAIWANLLPLAHITVLVVETLLS